MYASKPNPKPKSSKVPKGSHRMPDGSIMKNSQMKKPTAKTSVKVEETCSDTSRCTPASSLRYSDNLKVEENLEKKKQLKESDIFEGMKNSKKITSKLKK